MSSKLANHPFLDAARERVVIFDGAFGTYVQSRNLSADDFGGPELEGCNELLAITRPEIIAEMHNEFLEIGVDAIETATFGAFAVPLGEYDIAHRAAEINLAAARIAREAADSHSTPGKPRWVAGSIGPGTKFASLGQIAYQELKDAFAEQALALIQGGVDILLIETVYDLLGAKAAINGCREAMRACGKILPIQLQVTIETNGRMLTGTETLAALHALAPLGIDTIGLNCATGPAEMSEHLRVLSQTADMPVSCLPNAGLPRVEGKQAVYDLSPQELADYHEQFITELGISVVGGCCGTTPEHLQEVINRCAHLAPAARTPDAEPSITSIYSPVTLQQDTAFLMISERTNANGSKKFRELMVAEDWDACTQMARQEAAEGAHAVDLCVDYVGRDGTSDMDELARRFATGVAAPLVLDSTEPEVLDAGLRWIGGRSILNSANLEDGDSEGSRADKVFKLAREFGTAVICLLIDEEGQARDLEWKMRVARRLYALATERYGLAPGDLIFDALTFPLSTGDDSLRRDGIATIEAIRQIKAEMPGVFTTLGVSNVSFGLNPAARHVLNSVFLQECLDAGLDSAIVHPSRILPLHRIEDEALQVCRDLIWDRRNDDYPKGDPLAKLLELFADRKTASAPKEDRSSLPIDQRLARRIVDGDKDGLEDDLQEALDDGIPALDVINKILLEGMRTVGDLFASGEMQLPFVLLAAETMKASVAWLEPHLEKEAESSGEEASSKGKLVIATVKGDVHDIGKNLVDIILTNNGYEVFNLGIKVSINEMIEKALEVDADAIGMSGLLVKSTLIMRDNLEELNSRGLADLPVLLGGAALTRRYVERDLREVYEGRLFYGKDAFEGLRVMDRLGEIKQGKVSDPDFGMVPEGRVIVKDGGAEENAAERGEEKADSASPSRSPEVAADNPIFEPPFLGARVMKGIAIDDIAEYINETALFRNQWQMRPQKGETDGEFRERVRPLLRRKLAEAKEQGWLEPGVVYGYFCANSQGNDLIIWKDETRSSELTRFSFPRQTASPWLCIADFFRPAGEKVTERKPASQVAGGAEALGEAEALEVKEAGQSARDLGEMDYAAFHIVTMGEKATEVAQSLFAENRYEEYLYTHGLGVEMAEALAEYWHLRVREEWGFADEDPDTTAGLFRQRYRGGRYSWGYPACPDLEDNAKVADLLAAEQLGIAVGEDTSWQYHPEQTTSALICHHPQAKYFVAK